MFVEVMYCCKEMIHVYREGGGNVPLCGGNTCYVCICVGFQA